MSDDFRFHWCRSAAKARQLAKIFAFNITGSYISHSELQGMRAVAPGEWSPDIATILENDLVQRVDNPLDASMFSQTTLVAYLSQSEKDVGVFLVTFSRTARVPYAILEDMVIVASERGRGHGTRFIRWLDAECQVRSIKRMFLESGITNSNAHHLFEKEGFRTVSMVMMKDL